MQFKKEGESWKRINKVGDNIVKSIKVSATNILFKSDDEQLIIIQNFGRMLNSLSIPVQIICVSHNVDANDWKTKITNKDYYEFIQKNVEQNSITIKEFELIIRHHDETVIDNAFKTIQKCLKGSGLEFEGPNLVEYKKFSPVSITTKYVNHGGDYCRTMYVRDWPGLCTLGWLDDIYNTEANIDVAMFIHPVEKLEALNFLKKKLNQNVSNQYIDFDDEDVDYDQYDENIASAMRMRDELYRNGGKFFYMSYYITVKAKSLQELNKNYGYVKNILKGMDIEVNECYLQQDDGRKCTIPYGLDFLGKKYNFTTEPLKHFFPFISSNIIDKGGVLVGSNLLNQGLIFIDPFKYSSALMFILGQMGSGKSYFVKLLCLRLLYMGVRVDIWDAANEYAGLKELTNLPNLKIHHYSSPEEYRREMKCYISAMEENINKLQPRFLIIDEFWQHLEDDEIMNGVNHIARTGRKNYQGLCVITQIVEDLIENDKAKVILRNASIKALMQMQPNAAREVQKVLELTDEEVSFLITSQNEGILFAGSRHVQFKAMASENEHALITTNPRERAIMKRSIPQPIFKEEYKGVKLNVGFQKEAAATRSRQESITHQFRTR